MGLMKGGISAEQQVQENSMTAEQQRELKNELILIRLRRLWRIFCIGMFSIYSIIGIIQSFVTGESIIYVILASAGTWGLLYVFVLYVFLYLFAFRALQLFFYVKDLFNDKETRL